ncbi:hypothetical protein CHARACLAT_002114, partial [Characodon lateralis]|nr:hypothetical protein [Characodon lateralis]
VFEAERVRGRRGKRVWSKNTTGDPPQSGQFDRTILHQPGYKCSCILAAPTDQHGKSDCPLQSCPGIETEDDHEPAEAMEIGLVLESY